MKCIIVDDEPLAIEVIESYVERLDDFEIVAKCSNALKAFEILQKQSIDVIFLDIQMPKLTGIEFLKSLQNPPQIIFTTAYRDYAIESYELDIVDYLLKPISFDRFLKAISKLYKGNKFTQDTEKVAQITEQKDAYIYLKVDKKMVKLLLKDIIYIESLKDYVRIKTHDKALVTHQKISYLEEKLPEECFMRIHRSYIVSLSKVESYSPTTIEVPNQELPIGRNYKNQVMEVLNAKHQL
jgi:DNA-binding LytR/AlgR family response regulator